MFDFTSAWQEAWQRMGLIADPACLAQLMLRYAEPHRHYHGLQHLEECLTLLEQLGEFAERRAEIDIALWFHDAIYDPLRKDNELRSAAWAYQAVIAAGGDADTAKRIHGLIMASQHAVEPVGRDAQLLVDIDLAILGATPVRFAEYEQQIRAEYRHVPVLLFRYKRRALLRQFLQRPQLYYTPLMRQNFEALARENLALALK